MPSCLQGQECEAHVLILRQQLIPLACLLQRALDPRQLQRWEPLRCWQQYHC